MNDEMMETIAKAEKTIKYGLEEDHVENPWLGAICDELDLE